MFKFIIMSHMYSEMIQKKKNNKNIFFFQNLRKNKPLTPKRCLNNKQHEKINCNFNFNFNFMVKNKEMQILKS